MNWKIILAGLLVFCAGILSASAELKRREWMVDGATRQALVWIPGSGSTTNLPLVFVFHGHGGSMQKAARSMGYHQVWPEAVVVYMEGLPTPGALTDPEGLRNGWQQDAEAFGGRDLKFFDAVLSSLQKEYKIDPKRIFATGHSNGGGFTYLLWAERGDVFAAMAPSGAFSVDLLSKLKPKPALHLAGENDQLVKFIWQSRTMRAVRSLNGCAETGVPWASSGDLTGTVYPSATDTPFISLIHPGPHAFPAGAPALIVRFFKSVNSR